MGDKGGKKDKAKLQKQKASQQAKKKQGKSGSVSAMMARRAGS